MPTNSDTTQADSLDILTPLLSKAFAQMGQDVGSPEVQAQVQSSADQLRKANPGVDDKTLASNVAANLPAIVSNLSGSRRVTSGADETGELAAYKKQLKDDQWQARLNNMSANAANYQDPARDAALRKQLQDQAYAPSSNILAGIKANKQFYDNQSEAGRATQEQEQGDQEGLKTNSMRQDQTQKTQLLDPSSPTNSAIRDALKQQLSQMGVPPSALAQMDKMNGPQMSMFSQGFTKNEKERADINAVIAQTGGTRASTVQTQAQTAGTQLDNRVKKVDADIAEKSTEGYRTGASGGSLEGAPAGTFSKYGTKGQQDTFSANTKVADGLNAGAQDRNDLLTMIDQTQQLVNEGYTGPWANRLAVISPRLQMITKNLAAMEGKQQLGATTAAASMAASAATPDVSKDPSTLRAYLANLKAQLQRQEQVLQSMNKARQSNSLATFDIQKEAAGTKSFMLPGGRVITLGPEDMTADTLKTITSRGGVPIQDYHGGK